MLEWELEGGGAEQLEEAGEFGLVELFDAGKAVVVHDFGNGNTSMLVLEKIGGDFAMGTLVNLVFLIKSGKS